MAEKEYVLGNKAKDLYQFTRQATKQGPDDKVDAKDVSKGKHDEAKKVIQKMRRQGKIKPAPPEVPTGFPW